MGLGLRSGIRHSVRLRCIHYPCVSSFWTSVFAPRNDLPFVRRFVLHQFYSALRPALQQCFVSPSSFSSISHRPLSPLLVKSVATKFTVPFNTCCINSVPHVDSYPINVTLSVSTASMNFVCTNRVQTVGRASRFSTRPTPATSFSRIVLLFVFLFIHNV